MHLETQRVTVLKLPRNDDLEWEEAASESNRDDVDRGRWMWHGGAIGTSDANDNGASAIYCIPSNARRVLKVHLGGETPDRVEEIGMMLENGQNKWYGGIKVSVSIFV
jgi:hypothetical protein